MTEQEKTLGDLAKMVKAALVYDQSATKHAEDIAHRHGIGEDDSLEDIAGMLRRALGMAPVAEPAPPRLGQQVTARLLADGFRGDDDSNRCRFPAFKVEETVAGVTVEVMWVNAGDDWRARLLGKYSAALQAAGLMVGECDDHLHVREGRAVQEADHG